MTQKGELTPLGILREKYPELSQWIKSICRFGKIEDFIIADYKKERLHLILYTKDHQYGIHAVLSGARKDYKGEEKDNGYLGCIAITRKPRAGEDWNRGRDLADGSYSEKTWNEIVNDIVAMELVKVVKSRECLTNGTPCWCNPKVIKVSKK